VAALNTLARARLGTSGELGEDHEVTTGRGPSVFAAGDRLMFLRNERSLGVKNGTFGTVEAVTSASMAVRLDDGRAVAFDLKDYADLDRPQSDILTAPHGIAPGQLPLPSVYFRLLLRSKKATHTP